MIEQDLPFSDRTARRYMAVAADPRLTNRTPVSGLPPSWSTLYQLSRLDDEQWEHIEPHLSPSLSRRRLAALVQAEEVAPWR